MGDIFGKSYTSRGSVADVIPVNHTIHGCPPALTAIPSGIVEALASEV